MERVDTRRLGAESLLEKFPHVPKKPRERILISLNSSASHRTHPMNHPTDFINELRRPIYNPHGKKFHVRLLHVAIAGTLTYDSPSTDFALISLYEVRGQRHGTDFTRVIGHVPLPPRKTYHLHEVKNAAPLPLRFECLTKLQITVTNKRGEQIYLEPGQLPTLVEVEILEGDMDEQFTITCNTYHPQTHPSNTINEFTCPIPSTMTLQDYEVALQNITFPIDVYQRDEAVMLETEEMVFRWDSLSIFGSTEDFLGRVKVAIGRSVLKKDLKFGLVRTRAGSGRHVYIERKVRNDIDPNDQEAVKRYRRPMWIKPSITFSRACGQLWNLERVRELLPGERWEFEGAPNIALAEPGIVAALHCSIITPNLVGEEQERQMQLIPVRGHQGRGLRRYYEPTQLLFHTVMNRPFDSINFKLTEPHGELRRFVTDDAETRDLYITLLFRKRKYI